MCGINIFSCHGATYHNSKFVINRIQKYWHTHSLPNGIIVCYGFGFGIIIVFFAKKELEGFVGQRAIVLLRTILAKYCSPNPLIAGAYTDIGYYPKAKFHYREREHGSDQHILIYCCEGKRHSVQIKKLVYQLNPKGFCIIIMWVLSQLL
jgi:hypothetical protein